MRVHVFLNPSLTRIVTLPPITRLRFLPRDYISHSETSTVDARGHMLAHVWLNILTTNEYVRVLVFFVWRRREAQEE